MEYNPISETITEKDIRELFEFFVQNFPEKYYMLVEHIPAILGIFS